MKIYLVYGASGSSPSVGATLILPAVPAVAVPVLAVCPAAWVCVELLESVPAEHAFMQLRNPRGNATFF